MSDRSVVLFSGRRVSASGYLAALRVARRAANPALRDVLRSQVRETVRLRVSSQMPWWGRGRRWVGGAL